MRIWHSAVCVAWLAVSALCSPVNAEGHEDTCSLPAGIRPVVYLTGFGSGALFDSDNGFAVAFPDLQRDPETDDGLGFFGNITADVSLPLNWNAADLTQEESPLGPEGSQETSCPGSSPPRATS